MSHYLWQNALTLLMAVGGCAASASSLAASNHDGRLKLEYLEVRPIAALTGPDATDSTQDVDICGTDIGTMAELNGKVYFAFGDTFGFDGTSCTPFGPNWRSNVLGISSDSNPSDGITWDSWLTGAGSKAIAVSEGAHQPPFTGEQTRIPTAMVAVNDRLYMHYMSVHGFAQKGGLWLCNNSRFTYSDDEGKTWTEAQSEFGSYGDTFNMLALTQEAGRGNEGGRYIYAVGTSCGRFGGARVARVPTDKLLELDAWQYYTGKGWSAERDVAVEVIKPAVGEGSILWNSFLKRWLYAYLNENTTALELRQAEYPWGPWSDPFTLVTSAEYPQLYGAFMTPSLLKDGGRTLYFVMSLFGPYNTYVMEAKLQMRPQR